MEYVRMGDSGLKVSRACLGAMMFGNEPGAPCDEKESIRMIDAFVEAGNNFIDTANGYTGGQSEQVVGKAVAAKRDKVVVATKGLMPIGDGPNDRGLSRLYLNRALEASLRRLNTDYVDIYQCHGWDATTPIEETMEVLAGFVRSGKVRYLGCSNFTGSQMVEAKWAADKVGGVPFISLQPRYSLVARQIEEDVLPTCMRHGLGTMVYSPLGGGVLTGKYRKGEEPPADSRYRRYNAAGNRRGFGGLDDRSLDIADEVGKVASDLGATPTAVALAWVLSRRGVTSVIIGPRTFGQYQENMQGFDLQLSDEAIRRLNEVSRPPR